jgi:hypothetical protein
MMAAKGGQGTKLFESAWEQPVGSDPRTKIYDTMREF